MLNIYLNKFKGQNLRTVLRDCFLTAILMMFFSANIFGQSKAVKGIVRDASGNPLAGVSVVVSGSKNGTTTDLKGGFALQASENATLVFSFTNYETQVISVKGKSDFTISLKSESASLSEVVVIGYGTQKKKDLTGAVRKITIEGSPISTMTNVSPLSAIQGTPGVNIGAVTTAGGAPSVLIRGQRSLAASNSPLIVLDNVIFEGSLNEINTQDIATLSLIHI